MRWMSSLLLFTACIVSSQSWAQVQPSAQKGGLRLGVGGGIDYWQGDYNSISRVGPSAWVTAHLWRGVGVIVEGHSMIAGGDNAKHADEYKYYSGDGGITYTYYHWHRFEPFAKAEVGFSSLSFPHSATATYTHDTRTTWAIGGGAEYHMVGHLWARGDYTWDNFPNFYSTVTGQHNTLNPHGVTVGATWHLR